MDFRFMTEENSVSAKNEIGVFVGKCQLLLLITCHVQFQRLGKPFDYARDGYAVPIDAPERRPSIASLRSR